MIITLNPKPLSIGIVNVLIFIAVTTIIVTVIITVIPIMFMIVSIIGNHYRAFL